MLKDFKTSSQSGASMVVIIVGLALSSISIVAASMFFTQNKSRAVSLMGDSESLTHWSMLLRQTYSGKCLELEDVKVTFAPRLNKGGTEPIYTSKKERTAKERAASPDSKETLSYMRNALSKNYDISEVAVVQRSNIIGKDPGRVLADLKVSVIDKSSKKLTELTVPMLLDLDASNKAEGCMKKADAKDICAKNKGTFDEKATDQICAMAK